MNATNGNTVKIESYSIGKSISLTVEGGQQSFLLWLVDSQGKNVGNVCDVPVLGTIGTHMNIELEDNLPPVTEPGTYKLRVAAKNNDNSMSNHVELDWKTVPAKAGDPLPTPPVLPVTDPDTDKVKKVRERLNVIEIDLDTTIERIHNAKNLSTKNLSGVDDMLRRMRDGMGEISTIITSIETSKPTECTGFNNQMVQISEKMEELEDMCRGLRATAQKKAVPAQHTAPPPAPTTPPVDLGPINTRITDLEGRFADLADQLADKASTKDLRSLSAFVVGLDKQVTGLQKQVSGLTTVVEDTARTCNAGFDRVTAAVDELARRQTSSTAPTSATPATPPILTSDSGTSTVNAPATTQSAVPETEPTQVTAVNPPNKEKKKSRRESVNFFALVFGVLALISMFFAVFFYATRSQNIDAERIGASDTKSAASAEIKKAERFQIEMAEKMHALQQQVEGYRRQTLTMPPPLSPTVTNILVVTNPIVVTTNIVAPSSITNSMMTNTFGKLSYHLDRPIEGIDLGDTLERQPFVRESWSPTLMGNLYDYRHRGFNGYLYPR